MGLEDIPDLLHTMSTTPLPPALSPPRPPSSPQGPHHQHTHHCPHCHTSTSTSSPTSCSISPALSPLPTSPHSHSNNPSSPQPSSTLSPAPSLSSVPTSPNSHTPNSHTPCPSHHPQPHHGSPEVAVVVRRSPATRHLTHLDPWRRHSWEPGAVVQQGCCSPNETRSVSLEDLDPAEMALVLGGAMGARRVRDSRRVRDGSLSSLTEEETGPEHRSVLEEQSSHMHGCSASAPVLSVEPRSPPPYAIRPRSQCYDGMLYSPTGSSTHSLDSDVVEEDEREELAGNTFGRTFSFLRKISIRRSKNKEKERMRELERQAREREACYSNGHLYTSLTVSATTLCSACNKSITAKEALSCPTCNVTIHNRCRDTLPNCAKMKQRQQKMAVTRTSSAYQSVTLRNKSNMMRERPSSAIYPSDSLRQSLLGSRRGRSSLSLSKSVSTNNIAGILSQSTDSLNFRSRTMSMESLNDDGEYYTSMLEEMEIEGRDFEADSWSTAVDSAYLQTHRKDVIKRQDVIYELIQTELHHVRTLRIMEGVLRRGMLEEVQLEPGVLNVLFPCLERLLLLHQRFLAQLLLRRNHCLQPGSQHNFTIHQLGDVLLEQFSGHSADEMRKTYAEFCSRHMKAVKRFKELFAREKRLQYFIRRVSRGPLLRRHGYQECILLVTQRITKYPVLLQRILDNTKDPEEYESLSQALTSLRELLTSVDEQVVELERNQRLQEMTARLDPRAEAKLRSGALFRPGELSRRRLIHEGTLLWKTAGSRLKDVQVLLMTDILVFLQEKDQRYIFPCLDKPAVVSLQNLLVRDIANQERGFFLISSESSPPEMYELHAASKDDRNTWIRSIHQAVQRCPSRQEFPLIETEDKALLRRLKADIQQKDREVRELLQERVTLFSDFVEVTGGYEVMLPPNSRNLFRADTPQAPRAEGLLTDAIGEVDKLSELLLQSSVEVSVPCSPNGHHSHSHTGGLLINGQEVLFNGAPESPAAHDRNGNQMGDRNSGQEVSQRLVNLTTLLHALQAAVIKQDSILEFYVRESSVASEGSAAAGSGVRVVRSLSRDGVSEMGGVGELTLLQRQHSLLQEELVRLRGADGKLKDCEKHRAQLEKQLKELKSTAPGGTGGTTAAHQQQQCPVHRESETDPITDPQLPSQESMDQSDGLQGCSDVDIISDDDDDDIVGDDEDVKLSPRSESPRDLQDIPEEETPEPRELEVSHC
ncbi:rho guanine nucleotide exchange factor 1a isoform X2 [Engraulis encrasicolus]|uniref:rho guanine nucleotide exchange factor 1a isoform X2 n=1 Tax=Engraulis encrasicolus TaxID=184585 RepID=UPI002FD197D1